MSRDALQESLSAVMDNEADELELRRVLMHLMMPKPVIPGLVTKSLGR